MLFSTQSNDDERATCPGRKGVHAGDGLEYESGEKQRVKAEEQALRNHGDDIHALVQDPTGRPSKCPCQLNRIRDDRHATCQQHPTACQDGWKQAIEHVIIIPSFGAFS